MKKIWSVFNVLHLSVYEKWHNVPTMFMQMLTTSSVNIFKWNYLKVFVFVRVNYTTTYRKYNKLETHLFTYLSLVVWEFVNCISNWKRMFPQSETLSLWAFYKSKNKEDDTNSLARNKGITFDVKSAVLDIFNTGNIFFFFTEMLF